MKKVVTIFWMLFFSVEVFAEECRFPGYPINWILRYCSYEAGTDDEVAIQKSACFKSAEGDLKAKDECAINKKYKNKTCKRLQKTVKKYKSIDTCVQDVEVKPFFAGE